MEKKAASTSERLMAVHKEVAVCGGRGVVDDEAAKRHEHERRRRPGKSTRTNSTGSGIGCGVADGFEPWVDKRR